MRHIHYLHPVERPLEYDNDNVAQPYRFTAFDWFLNYCCIGLALGLSIVSGYSFLVAAGVL